MAKTTSFAQPSPSRSAVISAVFRITSPTSKIHTEPYSEDYPALGMEYVLPMEIMYQYRLVKEYTHYCPECKSPLHKYRGTDILKCPECGEYAMTWDGVPLWSVKKRSPSESA